MQLAQTEKKRAPLIRVDRIPVLVANFALILFSSTSTAGNASEYAFEFYRSFFKLSGKSAFMAGLLAPKLVHFMLFFPLGMWLVQSLNLWVRQRLGVAILLCFLVGSFSEMLQMFTGRDASTADVILNLASGSLAAVLATRETTKSNSRAVE